MIPYLFELSGEHPTLPASEALACVEAEGGGEVLIRGEGCLVASLPEQALDGVAGRIALTHRIGRYLGSCDVGDIDGLVGSIELPEGSLAVRVRRYQDRFPEIDSLKLAKRVGGMIGKKVDLRSPDMELRALVSDRVHLHVVEREVDRKQFERRKVQNRPFFSPISLHPRYARALVNLTRVRRGERLLDPFCGTGGILMEAALIGARALGSDLAQHMVDGCLENMEHFGIEVDEVVRCDIGDVREVFGDVDAIATDPPYGRSTSTNHETVGDLYRRSMTSMASALRSGGHMGLVLPTGCPPEEEGLELMESHEQRVHGSLTRTYCVLRAR